MNYPKLKNNKCWPKFTVSYNKACIWSVFSPELFLTVVVLTSTFEHIKNSLRTIEARIVQKLKNNEARPKFTGSYKKSVYM